MNVTLLNIMNGIARDAANAKDMNAVSVMQSALIAISKIGTAYDAAAPISTAFLNPNMPQNFDALAATAKQTGLTGTQLGG